MRAFDILSPKNIMQIVMATIKSFFEYRSRKSNCGKRVVNIKYPPIPNLFQ